MSSNIETNGFSIATKFYKNGPKMLKPELHELPAGQGLVYYSGDQLIRFAQPQIEEILKREEVIRGFELLALTDISSGGLLVTNFRMNLGLGESVSQRYLRLSSSDCDYVFLWGRSSHEAYNVLRGLQQQRMDWLARNN